jgi:hypothetical protein
MSSLPQSSHNGVLWLGDNSVLPGRAWPLAPGVGYSVTSEGIPDLTDVWRPAPRAVDKRAGAAIELAAAGKTVELGQMLAAESIRYVVVITGFGPVVPGLQQPRQVQVPPEIVAALSDQVNMLALPTQGGYQVYSTPKSLGPTPAIRFKAPSGNGIWITLEIVLWGIVIVGLVTLRRRRTNVESAPEIEIDRASVRAAARHVGSGSGTRVRRSTGRHTGSFVASTGADHG